MEKHNALIGYKVAQAMQKRNIEGFYCQDKNEAREKALELMPAKSRVGYGGSMTLNQIGLLDAVRNGDYDLIDRDASRSPEEKRQMELDALTADFFLMSGNAIAMDGTLVNIDGKGNRLAALVYGPRNVIVIAGVNKIAFNEEQAILRARRVAAPINALRLKTLTPCVSTGICHNCLEDQCICRNMVITRMSSGHNRIKAIIVGEDLGF
ncbi:MAG: lactate utilization protein [Clostridiales bacterium]|jgi:L-lactate utilization protein LutB|nr:lactate utilization protein [Clostridiales bacterium]